MPMKQPQARGDQLAVLEALAQSGATTAERAVKAPAMAGGNLLNRLYARGWIAKAGEGRWWLTEAGETARAYAAAYGSAQEAA